MESIYFNGNCFAIDTPLVSDNEDTIKISSITTGNTRVSVYYYFY